MISTEYAQGIRDSLMVIQNLLQHNDIKLASKEFFKEFMNCIDEGMVPREYVGDVKLLMKEYKYDNNKSALKN